MRLDQPVIGNNPAKDGYFLEFILEDYFEDTVFANGSGRFFIDFPDFAITGIEKVDITNLFKPIDYFFELTVPEREIELQCYFSGEFEGSGKSNITSVDVYSGSEPSFEPQTLSLDNFVSSTPVEVTQDTESLFITVSEADIGEDYFGQPIYYKAVPKDHLTSRGESEGIEATMASLFNENVVSIQESEVEISRSTALDYVFTSRGDAGVDIFNSCLIVIHEYVAIDTNILFNIRYDETQVTISGDGLPLSITSEYKDVMTYNKTQNTVTFNTGLGGESFSLRMQQDSKENRENFNIF